MNKPELIACMARKNRCTKVEARYIIESFMETVGDVLAHGESVNLSGFGSFKVLPTPAKKYRHPVTGEMEEMPAGHRIKFTPSEQLAEAIK